MDYFDLTVMASLLGGIGLFLLGMSMMTDGLKLAAGGALREILDKWTRSALRGLAAGFLITALVQSSSAVTVAIIGFVNAGLLTLTQAIWVVFGSNVGTTMTSWLVALVGVKIDVGALALPLIGGGMLTGIFARSRMRQKGLGQALAGFGIFFLGVNFLQDGFSGLAPLLASLELAESGFHMLLIFVVLGVGLTILTQSSSAAVAIALTATASGNVPLTLAAAILIGANIGTTSTALFAALSATPAAKRVAISHVIFNVVTGVFALVLIKPLLSISLAAVDAMASDGDIMATLAVFHTLFNLLGIALIWPVTRRMSQWLDGLFVSEQEQIARPRHIDTTLIAFPSLALNALTLELRNMADITLQATERGLTTGPAAARMVKAQEEGILQLGQNIRDFIHKLSGQELPTEVRDALPDLIRGIQHLEDLVREATWIATQTLHHDGGRPETWHTLMTVVLSCLPSPAPEVDGAAHFADKATALESAYEAIKRELLQNAARGTVPIAQVDTSLIYSQSLRRAGHAALKTHRRLSPRLNRVAIEPGTA